MIRLVEVSPRDGLQNESDFLPTEDKIGFINALSKTGVLEIEVTSFVRNDRISQFIDAEEVYRRIDKKSGVLYSALVPNLRGFERALSVNVQKINFFTAASNTFNQKNIHVDIKQSLQNIAPLMQRCQTMKLPTRIYISTAFWCPYEGYIAPRYVLEVMQQLLDMGADEIVMGDTIGKALRYDVIALLDAIEQRDLSLKQVAMHFHDTHGQSMEHVALCFERGIEIFDGSAFALGGCPYALHAPGNIDIQKLANFFSAKQVFSALDENALLEAKSYLEKSKKQEEI